MIAVVLRSALLLHWRLFSDMYVSGLLCRVKSDSAVVCVFGVVQVEWTGCVTVNLRGTAMPCWTHWAAISIISTTTANTSSSRGGWTLSTGRPSSAPSTWSSSSASRPSSWWSSTSACQTWERTRRCQTSSWTGESIEKYSKNWKIVKYFYYLI